MDNVEEKLTLKEKVRRLPESPGVYLMKDACGSIIYIGKAVNLKRRVSHYFQSGAKEKAYSPKIAAMISLIRDMEYIRVKNDAEALVLESKLIKKWKPRYNTLERDDKNFLLLRVETFRDLPKFTFVRHRNDDNALYFGPYLNPSALRDTINLLKKNFGIISSDASPVKIADNLWKLYDDARADIYKTPNIVSKEEYALRAQKALEFLNNRDGEIIGELTKKMEEASKKLDFEKAAKYRDAICAIQETKKMRALNQDPARAPRAEAANAARLLGEAINFGGEIRAMECFDISHIAGSFTVASMVHFDRGLPAKNKYRRFRLSTHNDDYASMHEAVSRRYKRLFDERKPMPDLVVIDGGKGQVKSALDAFDLHKIPRPLIIGLAKREETVVCSDKTEIKLPRDNEALKLLQRIRDEAHRFANSYRETLQRKKIKESVLDDFDGLGPKKKEALLKRFGSISKIKKATAEELAQADGIGPKTARALREFLDRIARENSAYDCD